MSGVLFRSSITVRDPLSDVLEVLGAHVVRRTRMEAGGTWAFAFPAVDRLKFVAVLRGEQWMLTPNEPPCLMKTGDVCLLGRTSYVVASDPELEPQDGGSLYPDGGADEVKVDSGDGVVAIGGSIAFAEVNGDFLLDTLPGFLLVRSETSASEAIAAILDLMSNEILRDAIGTGVVAARLADILVVEALRALSADGDRSRIGWLGAISDPRLGRALRAIHRDVASPWTVAALANVAGMSRAAFSAIFARQVGRPPLAYLRYWRLTLARSLLLRGTNSVDDVARQVGYTSQSAFGNAYRQAFRTSPRSHKPGA
ncbi:Helix-turn-helix domain-containing protein [Rhizobium sp. NFR07]|uniref:AraC family transcriptional regulator n=1 Tax=Rhizobium sp. NFR07 TaxID=1566262 RepID=UPI0008E72E08|nr:AraC family transcriptional regulator [Rhizobium sp. NFR07]SFB63932.1 Helix-turn-helix domain-containing protein [Rhizobium sp. NFR07]